MIRSNGGKVVASREYVRVETGNVELVGDFVAEDVFGLCGSG